LAGGGNHRPQRDSGGRRLRRFARTLTIPLFQGLGTASGFAREVVFAAFFGPGAALDAFLLAYLPIDLLITFARDFYTVLLPRLPRQSEARSWAFLAAVARRAALLAVAGMGLYVLFGALASGHAPGLGPGSRPLLLSAILAPAVLLMVLHGVACTHFVRGGSFALLAAAPTAYNVGILVAVVGLSWAAGIASAAAGMVLGAAGLLALACWRIARTSDRPALWWRRRGEAAPPLRPLRGPFAALAGENLFARSGILVERAFGAALGAGAISILNISSRLVAIPFNVILPVITFPLFPNLVDALHRRDRRRCVRLLLTGLAGSFLLAGGCIAALLVWRREIITLAFQRGRFEAGDAEMVSATLCWHAIGAAGWCVRNVCDRFLWAARRNGLSLACNAVTFLTHLAVAPVLAATMGRNGLALSTSIAFCQAGVLMLACCAWVLRGLPGRAEPGEAEQ